MKKIVFILAASLLVSGCATVFKGSSQSVTFNSEPDGASVIVEGNIMGKTPTTFNLKKNKYEHVLLQKEGYETQIVSLSTSYDLVTLLNIFWDLSTTDLLTGNAYEYEPSAYNVKLTKKPEEAKKN